MAIVLITGLYDYSCFLGFWEKHKADIVYCLIDLEPDSKQKQTIEKVKKNFKVATKLKFIPTTLQISDNAKVCLDIIDNHPKDEIILDITSAKKTRALGINYAGFSRKNVSKIYYFDITKKQLILLPKLTINLTKNQKKVLQTLKKKIRTKPITASSYYDTLKRLKDLSYVNDDNSLTIGGEIALIASANNKK